MMFSSTASVTSALSGFNSIASMVLAIMVEKFVPASGWAGFPKAAATWGDATEALPVNPQSGHVTNAGAQGEAAHSLRLPHPFFNNAISCPFCSGCVNHGSTKLGWKQVSNNRQPRCNGLLNLPPLIRVQAS
jgi:hypothetical protein